MKVASRKQQYGAITLIGAMFLIMAIIILLGAVQRMAATNITDTALQSDSVEALFVAETGLERAGWRYASGSSCVALPGESDTVGRGSFQIISTTLSGYLCQVRVSGSVITTIASNAVHRTIEGNYKKEGVHRWIVGDQSASNAVFLVGDGSSWTSQGPYTGVADENLNSVFCINPADCWAVGHRNGSENINHYDGTGWSRLAANASVPNSHLYSVHCVASNDCWAVGERGSGANINHWNGSNWSNVAAGSVPNQHLNSVYCIASNDCWTVGESSGGAANINHWNGSNWSNVAAGSVPNQNLNSITCVASNDCWAVGMKSGSSENINHWDGSTWSRSGPYAGVSNQHLEEVSMVNATEGYAVGHNGVTASWNGSIWSDQTSSITTHLRSVSTVDDGGSNSAVLVQWTEIIQ